MLFYGLQQEKNNSQFAKVASYIKLNNGFKCG